MKPIAEQSDGPDHGPAYLDPTTRKIRLWREQHGKLENMEATDKAGMVAKRVVEECLLDTLKLAGQLGHGEPADRRYFIGLWLRELFDRAGLRQRTGMAFEIELSDGIPEMSDAQGWNFRCWVETMRDVGIYGHLLREVCCFDRFPPKYKLLDLPSGLDRLADLRGL